MIRPPQSQNPLSASAVYADGSTSTTGELESRMQPLASFLLEQAIPVLSAAALNLGPRLGYFVLLPLSHTIEREYGNYGLFLGCAAAVVTSAAFGRKGGRFDLPVFSTAVFLSLLTVSPFVLARAGVALAMQGRPLDVLLVFAYLGFSMVAGVILAGCWSLVVQHCGVAER